MTERENEEQKKTVCVRILITSFLFSRLTSKLIRLLYNVENQTENLEQTLDIKTIQLIWLNIF